MPERPRLDPVAALGADVDRGDLEAAVARVAAADDVAQLVAIRGEWLGRDGRLGSALRRLGSAPTAERQAKGQALNRQRRALEHALRERQASLAELAEQAALRAAAQDVSLPGRMPPVGVPHPIMESWQQVVEALRPLGFGLAHGPEVEHDWYNFTALNMPTDHPARDMQDTFFLAPEVVLRTHTSNVQVRTMMQRQPPVRILAPGMVFRRDEVDATHSPVFHQVEGLWVDEQATFAELKGVLGHLMAALFGPDAGVRYRPSYFPFTEPSLELDISCTECGPNVAATQRRQCRMCRGSGWLEILGAGMVDPAVLSAVGYDPERVGGFAFGLGLERICMLRLGLDDMRVLYDNESGVMAQLAGRLPAGAAGLGVDPAARPTPPPARLAQER